MWNFEIKQKPGEFETFHFEDVSLFSSLVESKECEIVDKNSPGIKVKQLNESE